MAANITNIEQGTRNEEFRRCTPINIQNSLFLVRYSIYKNKKASQFSERLLMNMAATYSPALLCSTIGHEGLNFSVRYGKR